MKHVREWAEAYRLLSQGYTVAIAGMVIHPSVVFGDRRYA